MMKKEDFLKNYTGHLNEKQLEVVQMIQGAILLLAVPGSGKTTVLIHRLGYMLYVEGIQPENILTLTYTVAATKDMTRRFTAVFGEEYGEALEFRTINGICARIIYRYGQMIGRQAFALVGDEKTVGRILTEILIESLSEYPTESDVKNTRTLITYCKNMLLTEDEIRELGKREGIPLLEVYTKYNQYLRIHSLMDYDDQMIYAYRILKGSPEMLRIYRDRYRYICVDEAQDTSRIQHIIIGLLAGEKGNLFMVGDEDQSIYGFRAAYPDALLNFEKDYPGAKVLVMDKNYRSNARIVSAADGFIQHNKDRYEKHMTAVREATSEIRYIELGTRSNQYTYLTKAAAGCRRETAVLYRDNESALPLIDQLERKGIPYRMKNVDMVFFTHRVVIDVISIIKFAFDPCNAELFLRIYFKCQTFLRKDQAEQLCRISAERKIPILDAVDYAKGLNGTVAGNCRTLKTHLKNMQRETTSKILFRIEKSLGYGEYLERNNLDKNKLFILKMLAFEEPNPAGFLSRLAKLQEILKNRKWNENCPFLLSTIHSSKGLEYDQVYLMDVCDGVFPNKLAGASSSATDQDKKEFEEERRLFYVGMTRAKNNLNIFKLSDQNSIFIKEVLHPPVKKKRKNERTGSGKQGVFGIRISDGYEPVIGERVVQIKYGSGVIADVEYGGDGKAKKFTVSFDSGGERAFLFPNAFKVGMFLEPPSPSRA